jgi:hypothetical protein
VAAPSSSDVVTTGMRECCVCLSSVPEVVFMPCKHMTSCRDCSGKVDQCPLCRAVIADRIMPFV